MQVFSNKNVLEAAQERISWVYDEFPNVSVSFSGGKDSTVILELAIIEARKRGRLPVNVLFLDQECEWESTVEYTREVADRPEVKMHWIQVPFLMDNSASFYDSVFHAWDPEKRHLWMREKEPDSYHENVFGDISKGKYLGDFYRLFKFVYDYLAEGEPMAIFYGLRADESLNRRVTLSSKFAGYKKVSWSNYGGKKNKNIWKFGPIYDWKAEDVWTAVSNFEWSYNRSYDYQYKWGVSPLKMRVSSLVHAVAAVKVLKMVHEIEPETYDKLVKRMPGIDTYAKLQSEVRIRDLPSSFSTWEEYTYYMLEHLVQDKDKEKFMKLFDSEKIVKDEDFWKSCATVIQANDYYGTSFENLHMMHSFNKKFRR